MSGLRRFCVDFWWGFTHPGMALRQELARGCQQHRWRPLSTAAVGGVRRVKA